MLTGTRCADARHEIMTFTARSRSDIYIVQQRGLGVVEFLGKVHINFVRVEETFRLIPESLFFLPAELCDLCDGWRLIFAFAADKDRFQDLFHSVGAAFETGLFPGRVRIEEEQVFGRIIFLIDEADQVSRILPVSLS